MSREDELARVLQSLNVRQVLAIQWWVAEAWDEGFTRGFYSAQAMPAGADASESIVENPYRAPEPS